MEGKLAELTDKLYREGVEKGEKQAAELKAAAQAEGDKLIAAAKAEAERIKAAAHAEAAEYRQAVEAELALAGNKLVSTIKQRLLDLVTMQVVEAGTHTALTDPAVITDLLKTVAERLVAAEPGAKLEVLLPAAKAQEIEKALAQGLGAAIGQRLSVSSSTKVKAGFTIAPQSGRYRLGLTDEDFTALLGEYLRPRTKKLLFGS